MRLFTTVSILASLLLSAAIFGFFYAWVCSTMWGLDATDPRVAIAAMQAMNGSVRNAVFAPAFFGPPVLLLFTAFLLWREASRRAAGLFVVSGVIYASLGLVLTMSINVPMNDALALVEVPQSKDEAGEIWRAYSQRWQFWNQLRCVASAVSFLIAVTGALVYANGGQRAAQHHP